MELAALGPEVVVPRNSGAAFEVLQGQYLRVRARSIVDLVVFDLHNVRERFDQSRTKTNQNTIYITTGHVLYSKSNREMMTIVEDTFEGNHDLQKGMCSRSRHELAFRKKLLHDSYTREVRWEDLPTHGCWENLSRALAPYGIPPEDIPSPFNLFQHMSIDPTTGRMVNTRVRPPEPDGAYVTFRAEIDCLVGISACPDLTVGGKEVYISILEPK